VKLQKIAVWGFLCAGVLGVITGLRDTFAPGFFQRKSASKDENRHNSSICQRRIIFCSRFFV
jgi:hypothetical protein